MESGIEPPGCISHGVSQEGFLYVMPIYIYSQKEKILTILEEHNKSSSHCEAKLIHVIFIKSET